MKTKIIKEIKEDLIDLKIAGQFWDEVKSGKRLITRTKEEFLKDLETW